MVKLRDAKGHLEGRELRVIYGDETTLAQTGERTVQVERTNLTSRHMNGRLGRKRLGFSKQVSRLRAASGWEAGVYKLARSVKTRRVEVNAGIRRWQQRSPMLAAGITEPIWSIRELLTCVPIPTNTF